MVHVTYRLMLARLTEQSLMYTDQLNKNILFSFIEKIEDDYIHFPRSQSRYFLNIKSIDIQLHDFVFSKLRLVCFITNSAYRLKLFCNRLLLLKYIGRDFL